MKPIDLEIGDFLTFSNWTSHIISDYDDLFKYRENNNFKEVDIIQVSRYVNYNGASGIYYLKMLYEDKIAKGKEEPLKKENFDFTNKEKKNIIQKLSEVLDYLKGNL